MKKTRAIRVLCVDDHPIVREGMAAIMAAEGDIVSVGEAGDGQSAVSQYRALKPDVVAMDLRMPGMGGVDATIQIRKEFPAARIIVLTTYEGDEDIHRALEAGAQGYLIKGMPYQTLIEALQRVHSGGRFLPPPIVRALASRSPDSDLSAREHEVLRLLVNGKSNKDIALFLGITEATVKCHVSMILARLNVSDRTQAV